MLKFIKMILLTGALGVAMSSCVDSDDPDFQVVGNAYVIQKNNEYGGKEFATYAAVVASYGTVQEISLRRNTYDLVFLYKLGEGIYESQMIWGPLSNCNGTYLISAQDEKGNVAQKSFELKIDKGLGDLTIVEPLEYKGGKLTATWKKVDGTTAYVLVGFGGKEGFYRINSGYYSWTTTTNVDDNSISGTFLPFETISNLTQETELLVAVVAAYSSTGGNLFLEGNYYKIVAGQDGVTPVSNFD